MMENKFRSMCYTEKSKEIYDRIRRSKWKSINKALFLIHSAKVNLIYYSFI